ncbi:LysR family transcriptional regulator [Alicyclobacillus sp. ALC3]|uniref:LysR family transcriptional regulator n=1 Tax=Alicyclobacillus sp. ALC3 TaxID=2796143 RepID=UPI0023792FA6|nr:LysR family transcriptional regulator [Alicyclobacillus sp. ALC3]WDL96587.1 LysR family transcriptional regulator [Alicyclobacillus sp. ALC3]
MDFHQLNTFAHVAHRLNFTRAAEDLNMSQPAVSRQIEALERTIGLPLFHRIGRSISLTDAGYVLYKRCEQILELVESTQAAMDTLKNLDSGSLHVGCSSTVGDYVLPSAILDFTQVHPGIQVQVGIAATQEILRQMEEGNVDLAILAGPVESKVLYVEPFLPDELALVMSRNHPLTQEQELSFESIRPYPMLLRREGSHTRASTLQHFVELGWTPSHVIEFDTTEAIKQAVLGGLGIAFLSKYAIRTEWPCGLLHVVDSTPFLIPRSFYIASNKDRQLSPAVLAFKTFLRKNIFDFQLSNLPSHSRQQRKEHQT